MAVTMLAMFLTVSLLVQPSSACPGQSQLYLDLKVCPAVMQYHATCLEARLVQKGWNQGNIWCPSNYSVPIAGVIIQYFLEKRGGNATLIGANATDASGTSCLAYVPTAQPGQYWIRAQVAGVNSTASDQEIFQILPDPVAIIVPPLSTIWGVNYTVPIRVTTPCGYPIPNLQLAVSTFAGGQWVSLGNATTDGNGRASVTAFMLFAPGHYDLQVAFQGLQKGHFWEYLILTLLGMNPDCLGNYIFPGALEILPRATTLVAFKATMDYKDPVTLQANLTDELGRPVIMSNITFWVQVGGEWQNAGTGNTGINSVATASYVAPLYIGSYDLKANFSGDAFYLPSEGFNNLTVERDNSTITAATTPFTLTYSNQGMFSVQLTDDDYADVISSEGLNFSLSPANGNAYTFIGTSTTDANGIADLSYTPSIIPGVYLLKVEFSGNDLYCPVSGFFTDIVLKDNISISVDSPTTTYGSWVWLTGTLEDAQGNALPGKLVEFYVQNDDGSWLDAGVANTTSIGHAGVLFASNKVNAGVHLVKLQFKGDDYYLGGYSTDNLTVNLATPSVSLQGGSPSSPTPLPTWGYIGSSIPLIVHVTDPNGNPLAGVEVDVTVTATNVQSDSFDEFETDSSGDITDTILLQVIGIFVIYVVIPAILNYISTSQAKNVNSVKRTFLGVGINTFPQMIQTSTLLFAEPEINDIADSYFTRQNNYLADKLLGADATLSQIRAHYASDDPYVFLIASQAANYDNGYGILAYDSSQKTMPKYPSGTYYYTYNDITSSYLWGASSALTFLDCCESVNLLNKITASQTVIYYPKKVGDLRAYWFATEFYSLAMTARYSVGAAFDEASLEFNKADSFFQANEVGLEVAWLLNPVLTLFIAWLTKQATGLTDYEIAIVAYDILYLNFIFPGYPGFYWESPPDIQGLNRYSVDLFV
ncbi:MAG TPA: hypothetical protein VKK79_10950 [Candidatus Lokiarchaeia archaeon]|nr:hypothetical protein [Candidatus Lokiarchaeia archaeon]